MSRPVPDVVAAAPAPRRVDGVDAARGFALIGMFVAHVAPAAATLEAAELLAIADERPRLLFALTAGIGLGFISGGTRPITEGRGELRRQIAIRAVILIALGMLIWATLHPLVFIILDVYGVAFLVMLPLLFLSPRAALALGIASLAVTPALAEIGARTEFVDAVRRHAAGVPRRLGVGGAYPVIVWVPVMLIGLALAPTWTSASPRSSARSGLAGAAAASVFLPIASRLPPPELVAEGGLVGAAAGVARGRSATSGSGALVVAAMLLLTALARPAVRRVAGRALAGDRDGRHAAQHLHDPPGDHRAGDPGSRTGCPTDNSWELVIGLVVGSMAFAWLWRRYLGRGPLERLLRRASGRDRADAAAAPTSG